MINAIGRVLWWARPQAQASEDVSAQPPAPVRLERLLQAQVERPTRGFRSHLDPGWINDTTNQFAIFIHEVGPQSLFVHSPSALREQEQFEMAVLLPGIGYWKASAQVAWTLRALGGFKAELRFSAEDSQVIGKFFRAQAQP